jgi:dolichol-phosphate mannosyltransferase
MRRPVVAVAVPAFNEAEGVPGFVQEIDAALAPHVESLRLVVIDDASTDGTAAALEALAPVLEGELTVLTNRANCGHGPTLMAAYEQALRGEPDYVLQVDGDGQFLGSELRRMLVLLLDDAHAVCGVRRFRQDPWFRMIMTRFVRQYVGWAFAVRARDPNCPLRGYEAPLLRDLLASVAPGSLIPNLYLTILAARRGVPLLEVDVTHRVRRGASPAGTSWGNPTRSLIPWRLVRFSAQALRESLRFRRQLMGATVSAAARSRPSGRESQAPTSEPPAVTPAPPPSAPPRSGGSSR